MAFFLVSCGGKEPVDPTPTPGPGPDPKPPVETKDTKAPTITVKITEKNVIAGVVVSVKDNQLFFDQDVATSWTDDISKSCKVELSLLPSGGQSKTINSGDKLEEAGTLQLKVLDEAGNSSSAEIKLTLSDTKAPEIEVKISEKNVVAGVKVNVEGDQLFFDDQVAASWKDDYSESLTVNVQYFPENSSTGKSIESGETLFDAGKLTIQVADEFQNKATAEITLTAVAIYGLEILQGKTLQVDQEVNLLEGLTITEGLILKKVEVEENGTRDVVTEPKTYTPEYPGTINIILTLSKRDGSTMEVKAENLVINPLGYDKLAVIDLKPVDILPIIGQVESGDKQVYDHIDHLRLAEATRMRDMMWEYGAGIHSTDEYRQLMGRLVAGMVDEYPGGYDDFEVIGQINPNLKGNEHSHREWSILHTLVNHANLKVVYTHLEQWQDKLDSFIQDHPTSISIF
ncbi:MAG: hypothetical protein IJP49_01885 [Bacteroidales bacterium]|nr:hypothetical protein [Bacteroidales bacterium]